MKERQEPADRVDMQPAKRTTKADDPTMDIRRFLETKEGMDLHLTHIQFLAFRSQFQEQIHPLSKWKTIMADELTRRLE